MSRADDGEAPLVRGGGEQRADRARVLLVEAGGRLVDEQQARVGRERPGDRDPLALAGRQVRGALVEPLAETDREQRLACPRRRP